MIDASECPFPIAAKQIERSPAECCCLSGPSTIEEPTAIVNEPQPTARRYVSRCIVGIEPRKAFGPRAWRACIVLHDGGAFLLGVQPLSSSTDS